MKIKEDINFKPTIDKPMSTQSKGFEKNFKKTMTQNSVNLNEVDGLLSEAEQSLKKKIFSLAKMEALVFSDPKLAAVYEEMAENGEEKYGYHYNETIQNMIFNDYVLNSPKYLQKYKMAIPKEKKRRDASGINQLKKAGEKKMTQSGLPKQTKKPDVDESNEPLTKVQFLVNEKDPENQDLFAYFPEEAYNDKYKSGYSHVGQHTGVDPQYAAESRPATPEEYAGLKAELESIGYELEVINGVQETTGAAGGGAGAFAPALGYEKKVQETTTSASSGAYVGPAAWGGGDLMKGGKSKAMRKPIWQGGAIIQESNYITDPSGFEKYVGALNEETDVEFIQKNSEEYGSLDNMNPENVDIIKNDIQTGKMMEGVNPDMYNTIDDLKQLVQSVKQRTGKGLTRDHIPMLANEALYTIAIQMADKLLPVSWNDLPDTNSMWDYIDRNGDMSFDRLMAAVKEACNDRLGEEGMSLDERNTFNTNTLGVTKGMNWEADVWNTLEAKYGMKIDDVVNLLSSQEQFVNKRYKEGGNSDEVAQELWNMQNNNIKEETQTMIQSNNTSMSNKATPTGDQNSGVPMGIQSSGGGMNESDTRLLEELNNELNAYSIHQDKLKKMTEDRKPSSLVLRDRVGSENEANFKKDLQHSGTKEIIDVEKELQWKDQQTDVPKDPQKLGMDIEKKSLSVTKGEALKNVGDSTNEKGDEIPKRNLTKEEQDEVNNYRLGLGDYVYDNEVGEKFEDRMKADMGEELYKQRQEKLKFRGKAPMYNKEAQPTQATGVDKVQFDKEQSGWNERDGIKESMITGRYHDALGKRRLIDFTLNEVKKITTDMIKESLFELDFTGLGNTYNSKTVDNKVSVNEGVVKAIDTHKFYTDGKKIFAVKNPVQSLTEGASKESKPIVNEQVDKMKHLLGYKPETFTNTINVKKNRGF